MKLRLLFVLFAICLFISAVCLAGCVGDAEGTVEEEADAKIEAMTDTGMSPVDKTDPPSKGEVLKLSFSGENPAYHTGLLKETSFILNAESGLMEAQSSRPFEEPFGSQTFKGTDSVFLLGEYDPATGTVKEGILTIETRGTASGGESPSSAIAYIMEGSFTGTLDGDVWSGTVTGSSNLTQEWEGEGGASPVDDKKNVSWTWESVSRNVIE